VSAVAPSVADARQRSLRRAAAIRFEGKQLRSDIGWREIARARSEATTGARAPRD
jgi:phosphoribosylamine-glycine ligase